MCSRLVFGLVTTFGYCFNSFSLFIFVISLVKSLYTYTHIGYCFSSFSLFIFVISLVKNTFGKLLLGLIELEVKEIIHSQQLVLNNLYSIDELISPPLRQHFLGLESD